MHIREYFSQQANHKLSDAEKMRIYESYLDKSHRVLFFQKMRAYSKAAVFLLGLAFVVAVMRLSIRSETQEPGYRVAQVGDAFITLKARERVVQANEIGEILFAKGDISVTKDNQQFDASQLYHGDSVLLQPGAVLEFTIREGVKAKIVGPAELEVLYIGKQSDQNEYVINLKQGDFLEVKTIDQDTLSDEWDNIVIRTPNFELEKVHTDDELNVLISTEQDGKKTIENDGGELVIKKLVQTQDQKVFVSVKPNQRVQVNGDIELLSDSDVKQVVESDLAVRYDLQGEETDASAATAAGTSASLAEKLESDLLQETKQVISQEQVERLDVLLSNRSLMNHIQQMAVYQWTDNKSSFDIAYGNLLGKVRRVYELLGLELESSLASFSPGEKTLQQGVILTDQLIGKINESYFVEPIYIERLQQTLDWFVLLDKLSLEQPPTDTEVTFADFLEQLRDAGYETQGLWID